MQCLIRRLADPTFVRLYRSCQHSVSDAVRSDAACSSSAFVRLFSAGISETVSPLDDKSSAVPGAASSQSAAAPLDSQQPRQEQQEVISPHSFGRPYRPDIRRFVHPQPLSPAAEAFQRAEAARGLPSPQADLVDQYLAAENLSQGQLRQQELQQVVKEYQRFEGDTGSSEVQVALLTTRISQLAEHMRLHRKDFSTRRGLEACLSQRRRLLTYLRNTDFPAYALLISRLGLRDTYAKLDRLTLQIQQRRGRTGAHNTSSGKKKKKRRR